MNKHLVSIVIPVFNRGAIVSETLDSIIEQTYSYWECILVDDGSTDNTLDILQSYCNQDARFRMFKRPEYLVKGGNAARNFGFKKSCGQFINWFDSDDLMRPTFIQDKVEVLLKDESLDFVISKSVKFYPEGHIDRTFYYDNNSELSLTVDNFMQEKVHWLTPDLMIKKACVQNVSFDPKLFSGQEYNFNIRLLAFNQLKGFFLNKTLCDVRKHSNSIQDVLHENQIRAFKNKYIVALKTFYAVNSNISNSSRVFIVNRILNLVTPLLLERNLPKSYLKFLYLYLKTCGPLKFCILISYSFILLTGKRSFKLSKMVLAK